ncbi:hypothetical protein B0H66DRAFT_306813 [Apodospora peruviana]|uniref:Uncharacterized protein n=1 Tax=Apodospora peruviana TaxID=516989 RepID=A0AAE0I1P5_9PEZI|nr:hypothetical protein B0H66DRAFT_306813 [Apodospora peruviana]
MGFPVIHLGAPFRLDALGLVSLVGALEVATAIGALQRNWITDYLPLLGSFLVAEDRLTTPLPGFTLYNASDGFYVPVVSGWFSRWLIANLDKTAKGGTQFQWSVRRKRQHEGTILAAPAVLIGVVANGGLIAVAALQGDWYGVANATAMAVSALIRQAMLDGKIRNLDKLVLADVKDVNTQLPEKVMGGDLVAVVITTPDGNAAVFRATRHIIRIIITDLDPAHVVLKAIGWVAFVVHVVCIGQCYLLSQLLSIALLGTATVLTIFHVGVDRTWAGGWLQVRPLGSGGQSRRRDALHLLNLTDKEASVLRNYWQLPHLPEVVELQTVTAEFWKSWNEETDAKRHRATQTDGVEEGA